MCGEATYCPAASLKCSSHNHWQILDPSLSLCRACLHAAGAMALVRPWCVGPALQVGRIVLYLHSNAKKGCLWPASLECIGIKYLENYLDSLWCITVVRNTGQMWKERIDVCVYSSWNILVSPIWHFFGISFESRLSFFITLEINVLLPLIQVTLFWYVSIWD